AARHARISSVKRGLLELTTPSKSTTPSYPRIRRMRRSSSHCSWITARISFLLYLRREPELSDFTLANELYSTIPIAGYGLSWGSRVAEGDKGARIRCEHSAAAGFRGMSLMSLSTCIVSC
ncbi:unnamed protein product, partial [Mycena citricolor]